MVNALMIKKKPKNKKKNKYLDNIPSLAGIGEEELLRNLLKSPPMPKKEDKKTNDKTGD